MFGSTQVIFFPCIFVLQSFEDLVELPSAEDIVNFVKEQDQEQEELHFKVWLRTPFVIFPDANALKSDNSAENKYHKLYIDGIIQMLEHNTFIAKMILCFTMTLLSLQIFQHNDCSRMAT